MLFKLSNLNSNLALTLGYLNPALNNSALMIFSLSRGFLTRYRCRTCRTWFLVGLIIRFITSDLGTLRFENGDKSESVP